VFGVIAFFVLSAYLIGRLLLIERESTDRVSVRRYWVRRILRIWPLYFTLVLGVYIVAPVLRAHGHSASLPTGSQLPFFLSFTENWAAPIKAFPSNYLSMFWTVCVEEQIYFIFPVIMLLAWRPMAALLVAMVLAGPLSCYLVIHQGQPYPGVWNFTATHLDSFGIGLLLALADCRRGRLSSAWTGPGARSSRAAASLYFWCVPSATLYSAASWDQSSLKATQPRSPISPRRCWRRAGSS
jgi:peptidoglycan/LPS O-acetylase OafA/YrhL